jgi:hypothetical protein
VKQSWYYGNRNVYISHTKVLYKIHLYIGWKNQKQIYFIEIYRQSNGYCKQENLKQHYIISAVPAFRTFTFLAAERKWKIKPYFRNRRILRTTAQLC